MKLRLWIAEQNNDRFSSNVIGRTREEVEAEMKSTPHLKFTTLSHIEIDYISGFDLFEQTTREGCGRNAGSYKRLKQIVFFQYPTFDE
jgi:hypothetical protein